MGLSHLHSSPHGSTTQLSRQGSNTRLDNSNSKLNSIHGSNSQLSHHGSNPQLNHHGSNPQLNHHGSNSQLGHRGSNSHLSHHGSNSHMSHHGSDSSLNGDGSGGLNFPNFPTPEDIIKQTDRSKSLGNIFSCVQTQPLGQCYRQDQPSDQMGVGGHGGLNVVPSSVPPCQGPNGKGSAVQNRRKNFGAGLGRSGIKKPR